MCSRQSPEAVQFGEVNGPLQTWVSQKDAQLMQISCHAKKLPRLGASYIERRHNPSFYGWRGWDGFSLCTEVGLKLMTFLSRALACWDCRQSPPCPAFNLSLISWSWESHSAEERNVLLSRGQAYSFPLQRHRHLQPAENWAKDFVTTTVSSVVGVNAI